MYLQLIVKNVIIVTCYHPAIDRVIVSNCKLQDVRVINSFLRMIIVMYC